MQPTFLTYDISHKYTPSLCNRTIRQSHVNSLTVHNCVKNLFKNTYRLMEKGHIAHLYNQIGNNVATELNGITLFVVDDSKIPDKFIEDCSLFRARVFINSYTLNGVATIDYLVENGSTMYDTKNTDNPIFCNVRQDDHFTEITINGVGRVVKEIKCTNGNIIVLDNIANVTYVN